MSEGQRVLVFLEYKRKYSKKGVGMGKSSLMKVAEKFKILFRDTGTDDLDID